MWEKVKKVNPILALCIYGPLGKQVNLAQFVTILEPVSPFFGPVRVWIAPNLVKWDRVLPYCTSGGLWGPIWTISGHLRLILGPSGRGLGIFGRLRRKIVIRNKTLKECYNFVPDCPISQGFRFVFTFCCIQKHADFAVHYLIDSCCPRTIRCWPPAFCLSENCSFPPCCGRKHAVLSLNFLGLTGPCSIWGCHIKRESHWG